MHCKRIGSIGGWLFAGLVLLGSSAHAADVSVTLGSGDGFAIRNNGGLLERLRVDEATGNLSRNGALFVHTTGSQSLFVGQGAGNTSSSGASNTAVGSGVLLNNTSGYDNSAFGRDALRGNTTGLQNVAFGIQALRDNTTGSFNAAFGARALESNTTASNNSAFGQGVLYRNTTGSSNSGFGAFALLSNTSGLDNSAFGRDALGSNVVGFRNVAVGRNALRLNLSNNNTAIGTDTLESNTSGNSNVAVGDSALFGVTTGFNNIGIGNVTGGAGLTTGSNNIYLGHGVSAVGNESSRIRIGALGTVATHIAGIRGATTGNANAVPVVIDSNNQLGTINSFRAVKRDIRDMGDVTERLLALRPVTFHYKQEQTLPQGGELPPEFGLIAEEVAEVLPELVVYDEDGRPSTVKYHVMAPMLLNELKKMSARIVALDESMNARIAELEQRLSAEPQTLAQASAKADAR